jgi:hypothetical protein
MLRNGIILALILLLFSLAIGPAQASLILISERDDYKNFEEGLSLAKLGKIEEAYSKFKKASDKSFLLWDYSLLFMADIQKRLGKFDNTFEILSKIEEDSGDTVRLEAKKLLGETNLETNQPREAFNALYEYYSKPKPDKPSSRQFKNFAKAYNDIETDDAEDRKFLECFINFADSNFYLINSKDSRDLLKEILYMSGKTSSLARILESSGEQPIIFKLLRESMLTDGTDAAKYLAVLASAAQKLKDYVLKIKILKEMLKLQKDPLEKARVEIQIALAYYNANIPKPAIDYLRRAIRKSSKNFMQFSAYYYLARIEEDLGQLDAAYLHYKKIKNASYQNEDEMYQIIKSMFRAAWINYKKSITKSPSRDFEAIFNKFGLRVMDEGYIYWLSRSLKKEGKLQRAKEVCESLYVDYPLSYYGLLCGVDLKNEYSTEAQPKSFSIADFVQQVEPQREQQFQRATLLYLAGLNFFSKEELSKIAPDYNNTRELYLLSILYMFLDDFKRSVSFIDFIINQRKGYPGEDILKIYYPLKYLNFITNYSNEEGIDPFLILSLIRQESVFHVDAVSRAGALGLMQIMPSLGLKIAQDKELGELSRTELLNPTVNIKLGISHFAELVKKFGGNFIYALAAYNSSEAKVKEWQGRFKNRTDLELIEEIPYYETRKYVKMNIRNYLNYMRIYSPEKDWTKALPAN